MASAPISARQRMNAALYILFLMMVLPSCLYSNGFASCPDPRPEAFGTAYANYLTTTDGLVPIVNNSVCVLHCTVLFSTTSQESVMS